MGPEAGTGSLGLWLYLLTVGLHLATATVCVAKGKLATGVIGVVVPAAATVGAVRAGQAGLGLGAAAVRGAPGSPVPAAASGSATGDGTTGSATSSGVCPTRRRPVVRRPRVRVGRSGEPHQRRRRDDGVRRDRAGARRAAVPRRLGGARPGANAALIRRGIYNLDEFRDAQERLPVPEYLAASYYERWFAAIRVLLVEKGVVDEADLEPPCG